MCQVSWSNGWGTHHCGLAAGHDGVCLCRSGCGSTHSEVTA